MSIALVAWFAASLACDVAGQLCFKQGSRMPATLNPWVLGGVAIYAIEVVVWVRILSLVPLSLAFPIASLNFLAITLASSTACPPASACAATVRSRARCDKIGIRPTRHYR